MKRIKQYSLFICSAVAALFMLALAGCDLELRGDELGEVGKTARLIVYELTEPTLGEDGKPASYSAACDVVTNAGSTIEIDGDAGVTTDTGIAFSFCIDGNVTSDWTHVISTKHTATNLATMEWFENGDAVVTTNIFEDGIGLQNSAAWDVFLNEPSFVTISFAKDAVAFYRNGELVVGGTATNNNKFRDEKHTVAEQAAALINDLTNGGTVTTGVLMKNLTVTASLDKIAKKFADATGSSYTADDVAKVLYSSLKAE